MSMTMSIVGITVCGSLGAVCAWLLVHGLGLGGVAAAVVAVLLGMALATLLFVGFLAGARALGLVKNP
jgi:hypothetical protein